MPLLLPTKLVRAETVSFAKKSGKIKCVNKANHLVFARRHAKLPGEAMTKMGGGQMRLFGGFGQVEGLIEMVFDEFASLVEPRVGPVHRWVGTEAARDRVPENLK